MEGIGAEGHVVEGVGAVVVVDGGSDDSFSHLQLERSACQGITGSTGGGILLRYGHGAGLLGIFHRHSHIGFNVVFVDGYRLSCRLIVAGRCLGLRQGVGAERHVGEGVGAVAVVGSSLFNVSVSFALARKLELSTGQKILGSGILLGHHHGARHLRIFHQQGNGLGNVLGSDRHLLISCLNVALRSVFLMEGVGAKSNVGEGVGAVAVVGSSGNYLFSRLQLERSTGQSFVADSVCVFLGHYDGAGLLSILNLEGLRCAEVEVGTNRKLLRVEGNFVAGGRSGLGQGVGTEGDSAQGSGAVGIGSQIPSMILILHVLARHGEHRIGQLCASGGISLFDGNGASLLSVPNRQGVGGSVKVGVRGCTHDQIVDVFPPTLFLVVGNALDLPLAHVDGPGSVQVLVSCGSGLGQGVGARTGEVHCGNTSFASGQRLGLGAVSTRGQREGHVGHRLVGGCVNLLNLQVGFFIGNLLLHHVSAHGVMGIIAFNGSRCARPFLQRKAEGNTLLLNDVAGLGRNVYHSEGLGSLDGHRSCTVRSKLDATTRIIFTAVCVVDANAQITGCNRFRACNRFAVLVRQSDFEGKGGLGGLRSQVLTVFVHNLLGNVDAALHGVGARKDVVPVLVTVQGVHHVGLIVFGQTVEQGLHGSRGELVVVFHFGLHDLVLMACLQDAVCTRSVGVGSNQNTRGNSHLGLPVVFSGKGQGLDGLAVLIHHQLDGVGTVGTVGQVVRPVLLNRHFGNIQRNGIGIGEGIVSLYIFITGVHTVCIGIGVAIGRRLAGNVSIRLGSGGLLQFLGVGKAVAGVGLQAVAAANLHDLLLLVGSQVVVGLFTVVQGSNQVVGFLLGPYVKAQRNGHAVFDLVVFAQRPGNGVAVVGGLTAVVGLTVGAGVGKAIGIDVLQVALSCSQTRDAVGNGHVLERSRRIDLVDDFRKCHVQGSLVRSGVVVIHTSTAIGGKLLHTVNTSEGANAVQFSAGINQSLGIVLGHVVALGYVSASLLAVSVHTVPVEFFVPRDLGVAEGGIAIRNEDYVFRGTTASRNTRCFLQGSFPVGTPFSFVPIHLALKRAKTGAPRQINIRLVRKRNQRKGNLGRRRISGGVVLQQLLCKVVHRRLSKL